MTVNNNKFDDWVGREEKAYPDVITPRLIESYKATFGGILADVDYIPPALHWCLAPPIARSDELGHDGHLSKGNFLPPIPLPRRMWAGGEIKFEGAFKAGDEVRKTSRIDGIHWKHGKSGEICFVKVINEYLVCDKRVIQEKQDIVYRGAVDQNVRTAVANPLQNTDRVFDHEINFHVDPVILFRYSALTFNAHKIHYDLPYAKDVEGYSNLVIHGPLQATLLLNFATGLKQMLPKRFQYRGVAPATGTQNLQLGCKQVTEEEFALEVICETGQTSMTATAFW